LLHMQIYSEASVKLGLEIQLQLGLVMMVVRKCTLLILN
jgi:hypothetical protein